MAPVFQINFYTERKARGRARLQGAFRTGLAATLMGIQALLAVTLLLSVFLLKDRANNLAADLPRVSSQALDAPVAAKDLDLARELYRLRADRVDWAPKLAALSEIITPELVLEKLEGEAAHRNAPAQLEIRGRTRSDTADLEPASHFIENLRQDSRFHSGFSRIDLGTIRSGSGEFMVIGSGKER